jgi:hypothetical protein
MNRGTWLGEFLPIGLETHLAVFLNTDVTYIFWLIFNGKIYAYVENT